MVAVALFRVKSLTVDAVVCVGVSLRRVSASSDDKDHVALRESSDAPLTRRRSEAPTDEHEGSSEGRDAPSSKSQLLEPLEGNGKIAADGSVPTLLPQVGV